MYTFSVYRFHKLVVVLLKLSGFDPSNGLSIQLNPTQKISELRMLKIASWVYSLAIIGVLLTGLVAFCHQVFLGPNISDNGVSNMVFRLWTLAFFVHVLTFPLVFILRRKRIIKIDKVFDRWIDEHLSLSNVPIIEFLAWGFFTLIYSTLPMFYFSYTKFQTLFDTMIVIMLLFSFVFNITFLLFNIFVEKMYMKTLQVCLTTIENHLSKTPQVSYIREPNFVWHENGEYSPSQGTCVVPLSGDCLKYDFNRIEFFILDAYGLVDEFASVFGMSILVWTLASLPNYFVSVYMIYDATVTGNSFMIPHIQNVFLLLGQIIFSMKIYSIGDTLEETVSKHFFRNF